MPRFFKKGIGARKGKRAKRAQPRKLGKSMTKAIQSLIHKDVETKSVYTQQFNTFFNSAINSSGDVLPVLANMGNGTGDSQRIGDQVRGQQIRIKGNLLTRFTGSAGTTYYQNCRVGVRLMIVQPKMYNNLGAIQANAVLWQSTLLKKGATTTGFTGIIPDLYADINRDAISVYYDKVFYVQNPYSNAVFGSTMTNLLMPTGTCKFFNKTIKLRNKVLKFDTSIDSGLTPTNFNPVAILGYCYLDGSSPDAVTTQIAMSFDSYMDYEDA